MELLDRISELVLEKNKEGANIYDLAVWQDGMLQSRTFLPSRGVLNCYSVTKNYIVTAIGMLIDEGKLSLTDTVPKLFDGYLPEGMPTGYESVTLHHLLCQTSGISKGFLFEEDRYLHGQRDWLKLSLSAPLDYLPGEFFCYSNTHYYLLSRLVGIASGIRTEDFLRTRILDPLGIETHAIEPCPKGFAIGATGLHLYTEDMMKLGIAYLEGNPILSKEWIALSTQNQVNRQGQARYGYGFWLKRRGYEMNGKHGQIVEIVPSHHLVVACHAAGGCDMARVVYSALGI